MTDVVYATSPTAVGLQQVASWGSSEGQPRSCSSSVLCRGRGTGLAQGHRLVFTFVRFAGIQARSPIGKHDALVSCSRSQRFGVRVRVA